VSHPIVLQCSHKITINTRQSNTTEFNKWHSTLLHILIPVLSSGNLYKSFKTHQFFMSSLHRMQIQEFETQGTEM